jgi:glyoxylase-like metal-dependent hydrolase (beta-lactamase superfamily II)
MTDPIYEIHAIRYATLENWSESGTPRPAGLEIPLPMDYYLWALVSPERTFVIDTGFDAKAGGKRRRQFVQPVEDGLAGVGIRHDEVKDVVLTHLHYDHAGNPGLFPNARFHLQKCEMEYSTGPCMCEKHVNKDYEPDDIARIVNKTFDGQVAFLEGDVDLAPGVSLHKLGGHTPGMQCVRVLTRRGAVVLASDASHFYMNFQEDKVFPVNYNRDDTLAGYRRLRELAESDAHIIPGHDSKVLRQYPPSRPELAGFAARLDADPIQV